MVFPLASDVVFIDSLHVSANIGPDCWDRDRAQPIDISVYLYLKESYLDRAGASDNVLDSISYSDLTKKVSNFIKTKSESEKPGFSSPDELINAVTELAFDLAGEAAEAVRVTLGVPKMILLAAGFSVDITTANDQSKSILTKRVLIKDLILPVMIGVNPVERKSKQRVKVNVIFHENTSLSSVSVNYQQVVAQLCQEIESSSYLTLETFVMQVLKTSCMFSDRIEAVTACAQKPNALSFAESSGVEITRKRQSLLHDPPSHFASSGSNPASTCDDANPADAFSKFDSDKPADPLEAFSPVDNPVKAHSPVGDPLEEHN